MSHRHSRFVAALGTAALLAALFSPASAAPPTDAPAGAVAVEVANGFRLVAEEQRPNATVLSTFASATETVRTIGWGDGSSISFFPGKSTPGGDRSPAHGSLTVGSGTERPQDPGDIHRFRDSGRTVVGDLVDLGMPREDAERLFGDMDTMDGSNPYTGEAGASDEAQSAGIVLASSASRPEDSSSSAVPSSSTTPYDVRCFNVSAASGKIEGYGCTTYYLVHQSGLDWWFNVKYKFSARSTDTSLFPVRLKGVAWRAQWSSGNIVYDWEPDNTESVGSCRTITATISGGFASISSSGTVCPNSHGPWQISSIKSGALWQGAEQGTAWEAAVGVQKTKNPAGVATNYYSYYWLEW